MKNQPNKATVKDGLPIPKPTGDFTIGKADKVGIDGHYYHYQTVCRMLQEYSDQQNAELLARKESAMRELNALNLQSLGKKLGIGLGLSVSENVHRKVDGLLERVKELEAVLIEADQYLSPNPKNYIGSGSILHQKMQEALKK